MEISTIQKVEVLYFSDCPSWQEVFKILEQILEEQKKTLKIDLIKVETNEQAFLEKFVGSPTIRINGNDLFPINQINFALGCRLYNTPEGYKVFPTREMIVEKLSSLSSQTHNID